METILRDYRHAKKIFVESNYRLSPKYGFLFYVEFDFNPLITSISTSAAQELGMVVKSVTLPKFSVDTKTHNAYNRKNIVQNKINYDPVSITFHDDQADNVRNFWYDYYSYFYRDPDYADATYSAPHKYQSRPSFDWGYTPRPAVGYTNSTQLQPYQYIQAVRIYSLYQQNFSEYELVNPIITSFRHGDHANGQTDMLQHEMALQFETVKYKTGYTTEDTAGGYTLNYHYDKTISPNGTQPGETAPNSYPDTITDLANNATAINPNLRTDAGLTAASLSLSGAFGSALTGSILGAAGTPGNFGGFNIPSFGSLSQGIPSAAAIGQQLQASAIGLAGSTASSLANGVIGGLASGLGPNGRSIIGLAAASIQNPQAVLRTAENMAIGYATGLVSNYVNTQVGELSNYLSREIGSFVTDNISQPLSEAFGDASSYLQNSFADISSQFNVSSLNESVMDTFSVDSDTSWFSSESFD